MKKNLLGISLFVSLSIYCSFSHAEDVSIIVSEVASTVNREKCLTVRSGMDPDGREIGVFFNTHLEFGSKPCGFKAECILVSVSDEENLHGNHCDVEQASATYPMQIDIINSQGKTIATHPFGIKGMPYAIQCC